PPPPNPGTGDPPAPSPPAGEPLELSLRARLMRDRRLHDVESHLPRDRMPGVRPTIERGGGGRSPDGALASTGRPVGASRLELRALIEPDAAMQENNHLIPRKESQGLSPAADPSAKARLRLEGSSRRGPRIPRPERSRTQYGAITPLTWGKADQGVRARM